jgi:hypothetical protein
MNVNFMDACHLRIRGKDIYKENIKQLKRAYILRKTIRKYSKMIPTALGLASLGATAMLTVHQMERKRVEAAMKLCKDWDDYKRIFVNQLEQEA